MQTSTEWLTTSESADMSGYHPEYIRELLRDGKIEGRKFGIAWQVSRQSLFADIDTIEEEGEGREVARSSALD